MRERNRLTTGNNVKLTAANGWTDTTNVWPWPWYAFRRRTESGYECCWADDINAVYDNDGEGIRYCLYEIYKAGVTDAEIENLKAADAEEDLDVLLYGVCRRKNKKEAALPGLYREQNVLQTMLRAMTA